MWPGRPGRLKQAVGALVKAAMRKARQQKSARKTLLLSDVQGFLSNSFIAVEFVCDIIHQFKLHNSALLVH